MQCTDYVFFVTKTTMNFFVFRTALCPDHKRNELKNFVVIFDLICTISSTTYM